ncbi:MAG: M20/M25/M40 family metallo-hydrolase, partial [Nanoarchaeota archaeon]|nr:M20/M25/M40 family metallo-hydrolase [Nanoarchaeota archaeon]
IDEYTKVMVKDFSDQLCSLVKIPSVSQVNNPQPLREVLEVMQSILQKVGFSCQIVATKGFPVLVGSLIVNESKPWVLVYNHLDVQPAAEPEWKSDPFVPLVRDGRIIGRGSTDDKGPALTVVHAINFLKDNQLSLPNIQVVYETEEEIGSPNFGSFLDGVVKIGLLRKPLGIIISDSIFEGDVPAVDYKLRGVGQAFVALEVADKEVHSGLAGGVAVNPLEVLMRALISCKNADGSISVPEWYDSIKPLSLQEKELTEKVARHFDRDRFQKETGVRELLVASPEKMLERIWHLPTLEFHGFENVQYLPGSIKTAIPRAATAKVTFRMVPGQDPGDLLKKLEQHLKKTHAKIVVRGHGQAANLIDIAHPFIRAVIPACLDGFGKEPFFVGSGGSIGAVTQFQRVWKDVPVLLLSLSLLSDGYHAPNEEFQLLQFQKGCKTWASFLQKV